MNEKCENTKTIDTQRTHGVSDGGRENFSRPVNISVINFLSASRFWAFRMNGKCIVFTADVDVVDDACPLFSHSYLTEDLVAFGRFTKRIIETEVSHRTIDANAIYLKEPWRIKRMSGQHPPNGARKDCARVCTKQIAIIIIINNDTQSNRRKLDRTNQKYFFSSFLFLLRLFCVSSIRQHVCSTPQQIAIAISV